METTCVTVPFFTDCSLTHRGSHRCTGPFGRQNTVRLIIPETPDRPRLIFCGQQAQAVQTLVKALSEKLGVGRKKTAIRRARKQH